jgi:flavin-binding protein dodecin
VVLRLLEDRTAFIARVQRLVFDGAPFRVNPIGEFVATKKAVPTETGVYRVIDVIGTSPTSWEDAAKNAVETAGGSLRDLRIAEVARLDVKIEGDKVVAYRARLQLSFKYEPEG